VIAHLAAAGQAPSSANGQILSAAIGQECTMADSSTFVRVANVLCLSLAREAESRELLQVAVRQGQHAVASEGGTIEETEDVSQAVAEALTRLDDQECWRFPYSLSVRGGAFDGLAVLGLAGNKTARRRAAHLALCAAILVRSDEQSASDPRWAPGIDALVAIVEHLPWFEVCYGAWPRDVVAPAPVVVPGQTWGASPPYRNRELEAYTDHFKNLVTTEWWAECGDFGADGILDLGKALASGKCIANASVHEETRGYVVRWQGAGGSKLKRGVKVETKFPTMPPPPPPPPPPSHPASQPPSHPATQPPPSHPAILQPWGGRGLAFLPKEMSKIRGPQDKSGA